MTTTPGRRCARCGTPIRATYNQRDTCWNVAACYRRKENQMRKKETALDRAKQTALCGRRIDMMKITAFSRAIDQAIAEGATQDDAISAAVRDYTEPAP